MWQADEEPPFDFQEALRSFFWRKMQLADFEIHAPNTVTKEGTDLPLIEIGMEELLEYWSDIAPKDTVH